MRTVRRASRTPESHDRSWCGGSAREQRLRSTVPVKLRHRRSMHNITVSVPDDVYRQAKIKAAQQGWSVNALVAQFLTSLGGADGQFRASPRPAGGGPGEDRARDRLGREELHDRAVR